MDKITIYVTGANGFIGSNLIKSLDNYYNFEVFGISRGNNNQIGNILYTDYKDIKWLQQKICNKKNIVVVHTAAYIPNCFEDYFNISTFNINKKIMKFICRVFSHVSVNKFIYLSSISVYGYGYKNLINISETHPLVIKDYYAQSKSYGEELIKKEFSNYVIFRLSSPYGPNKKRKTILENMIDKALKNQCISVYGQGQRTQDFIYIEDINRVIKTITLLNDIKGVYNLGSGFPCKMIDLAKIITKIFDSKSKIKYIDKQESNFVSINNNKIKELTNLLFLDVESGLKSMYRL